MTDICALLPTDYGRMIVPLHDINGVHDVDDADLRIIGDSEPPSEGPRSIARAWYVVYHVSPPAVREASPSPLPGGRG